MRASPVIRFLHVVVSDTVANVAVSKANHVWLFCWAWPRFSCCFAALTTKRMSGRGICGHLVVR